MGARIPVYPWPLAAEYYARRQEHRNRVNYVSGVVPTNAEWHLQVAEDPLAAGMLDDLPIGGAETTLVTDGTLSPNNDRSNYELRVEDHRLYPPTEINGGIPYGGSFHCVVDSRTNFDYTSYRLMGESGVWSYWDGIMLREDDYMGTYYRLGLNPIHVYGENLNCLAALRTDGTFMTAGRRQYTDLVLRDSVPRYAFTTPLDSYEAARRDELVAQGYKIEYFDNTGAGGSHDVYVDPYQLVSVEAGWKPPSGGDWLAAIGFFAIGRDEWYYHDGTDAAAVQRSGRVIYYSDPYALSDDGRLFKPSTNTTIARNVFCLYDGSYYITLPSGEISEPIPL